jgi:glutamyl endopeptidase
MFEQSPGTDAAQQRRVEQQHAVVTNDGITPIVVPSPAPEQREPCFGRDGENDSAIAWLWSDTNADPAQGLISSRPIVASYHTFPHRAVVLVFSEAFGPSTGWLFGPDIVATAGHCVSPSESVWMPVDGKHRLRIGYRTGHDEQYRWCNARRLYSVRGWSDDADERCDYGAIKLDRTIGDELGWFGLAWSEQTLPGREAVVLGYGTRPWQELRTESDFTPIQFSGHGYLREVSDGQAFYDAKTDKGTSGGPVFARGWPDLCPAAIHTTAAHPDADLPEAHRRYSHGTAISRAVFDNLIAWRADGR